MPVTLQQIADIAGVSRTTVDRALYNRGRIKKEVAERIRSIAQELGYTPSLAGKALSFSKKNLKIGVIVHSSETPFIRLLIDGIYEATAEASNLGIEVILKCMPSISTGKQLEFLKELEEQEVSAIAISPADDCRIASEINRLMDKGVAVVTFNTDIEDSRRLCFVGQDGIRSGQTAASLMDLLLGRAGGKVLVITAYHLNRSHNQRVQGFVDEVRRSFPGVDIVDVQACFDDSSLAASITRKTIIAHPDLKGIYICANGQEGVCEAVEGLGKKGVVRVICYDDTPQNCQRLKDDQVDFVIGQNARRQGYEPISILMDYLFYGKQPAQELLYTNIDIQNKYNV